MNDGKRLLINFRGTSGSGKSTLVRQLLREVVSVPFFRPRRRVPLGYQCLLPDLRAMVVLGSYENACGGCDGLSSFDDVYDNVRLYAESNDVVLFEGLLLSSEKKRTMALAKTLEQTHHLRVVGLEVDIEECIRSVNERRQRSKPGAPPLNPANTRAKHRSVNSTLAILEEAGVEVLRLSRQEALQQARSWLGLPGTTEEQGGRFG